MSARAMPDDPMEVRADEFGLLRVFAAAETPKLEAEDLSDLLGVDLDATKAEIVDPADIAALGLPTYLVEGQGISANDLAAQGETLEALDGQIVLVPTSAFQDKAQKIAPKAALRFVGIYRETAATPPVTMAQTTAAEGGLTPTADPAADPGRQIRRPWAIIAVALIIGAALVLLATF